MYIHIATFHDRITGRFDVRSSHGKKRPTVNACDLPFSLSSPPVSSVSLNFCFSNPSPVEFNDPTRQHRSPTANINPPRLERRSINKKTVFFRIEYRVHFPSARMWKRQLHDNLNFLEISAKSIPSTLPSSLVSRSIAISQGESEGSDFYQPWRRGIRVEAGVGRRVYTRGWN